jgi:hypothetical protein
MKEKSFPGRDWMEHKGQHSELALLLRLQGNRKDFAHSGQDSSCFSAAKLPALAPLILCPIWTCFRPLCPNTARSVPADFSPWSRAM